MLHRILSTLGSFISNKSYEVPSDLDPPPDSITADADTFLNLNDNACSDTNGHVNSDASANDHVNGDANIHVDDNAFDEK